MNELRYLADGTIASREHRFSTDLNERLNLNYAQLRHNRKATLSAFVTELNKRNTSGRWSKSLLRKELKYIETTRDGSFREYVEVLRYWLQRKIDQR